MSLSINSNSAATFIQNQLSQTYRLSSTTNEQLTSGSRINRAADDAAGLSISTGMNSQIRGMQQAVRNTNDGISLLQTADGALFQGTEIVQRMRELTLQYANGTLNDKDRAAIDKEYGQLLDQLDSIQQGTSFNGRKLFGEESEAVNLQVGDSSGDQIGFNLQNFDIQTLKNSPATPQERLAALDSTLENINSTRADFGAISNRLESTVRSLGKSIESTVEANSRIADTDYAKAISERTAQQIKEQVQIALLSQANSQPKQVLRLLGQ